MLTRFDGRKLKDHNFVERLERLESLLTDKIEKPDRSGSENDELPSNDVQLEKIDPFGPGTGDADSAVSQTLSILKWTTRSEYLLGGLNLFHRQSYPSQEAERSITVNDQGYGDVGCSDMSQVHRETTPSSFAVQKAEPWKGARLPARETTMAFLSLYYESPFSIVFPIADPILFPIIVDKAYNAENAASTDRLSPKACVYSFMAFISIVSDADETRLPPNDVEGYVMAAQLAMANFMNMRARTEAINALMMLVSRSIHFLLRNKHNPLKRLCGFRNFKAFFMNLYRDMLQNVSVSSNLQLANSISLSF